MMDTLNYYSAADKFQSERSHKEEEESHCLCQLSKAQFDTRQHICPII